MKLRNVSKGENIGFIEEYILGENYKWFKI